MSVTLRSPTGPEPVIVSADEEENEEEVFLEAHESQEEDTPRRSSRTKGRINYNYTNRRAKRKSMSPIQGDEDRSKRASTDQDVQTRLGGPMVVHSPKGPLLQVPKPTEKGRR
jgi:3,4-dihydroxy-2-butanone 4-phosphate synthase